MRLIFLLSSLFPFDTNSNGDAESLSNLPKIVELVRRKARIQTLAVWLYSSYFFFTAFIYTASGPVSLHPPILIYYFVEHFYHFKILNICLFVYYLSPLPKCQAHENRDFILLFNVYKCREYSRYINMFCESMNERVNIILCAGSLAATTQVELGHCTPPFCFQPSCFCVRICQ